MAQKNFRVSDCGCMGVVSTIYVHQRDQQRSSLLDHIFMLTSTAVKIYRSGAFVQNINILTRSQAESRSAGALY